MEPVEGRTGPGQGLWFTAPAIGKARGYLSLSFSTATGEPSRASLHY
jgi:hypothetical protein